MPYRVWTVGWCGGELEGEVAIWSKGTPSCHSALKASCCLVKYADKCISLQSSRRTSHVRKFYFADCPLDKRNLISEPTQKARCALWVYWSGSTTAAVSSNVSAVCIIRNMLHAGCSKLQELNKPDRGPSISFQGEQQGKEAAYMENYQSHCNKKEMRKWLKKI